MVLAIDPTSLGSRTRPATANPPLALSLIGNYDQDDRPLSVVDDDKICGPVFASGCARMRHVCGDLVVYATGLLAPTEADPLFGRVSAGSETAYLDWALNDAYFGWTDVIKLYVQRQNSAYTAPLAQSIWFECRIAKALEALPRKGYWQVLIQPDPKDTLQAIADAINCTVATLAATSPAVAGETWFDPDPTLGTYYGPAWTTGTPATVAHPFLSASVVNGDTLRVKFRSVNDVHNATSPALGASLVQDTTPTPSSPVANTQVRATPGYYPESHPDGTVARIDIYTGTDADASNFGIWAVYDNNAAPQRLHFLIMFVGVLGAANQYWQVKQQGNTAATMGIIEKMFRGIADAANYTVANPAHGLYASIGISDWEFIWGSSDVNGASVRCQFRTKTPGARKNRAYMVSTGTFFAGSPDPGIAVYKAAAGGTDPIATVDVELSTPGPGDYRYGQSFFRSLDFGRSAFGKITELDNLDGGTIRVEGFEASADTGVDYNRIWRTLMDGLGDYFKVVDLPVATLTYDDDLGDGEIAGQFGSQLYNPREYRSRIAGYPPMYRHLVRHQGSVWGAGISRSAPKRVTATFVVGSDQVTIAAAVYATSAWVGRTIGADAESKRYLVIAVAGTSTLTISEPFDGTAGAVAATVLDDRRATQIGRSEPGFVNQWPTVREWTGIDTRDELGVTAIASSEQRFFAWTRDGIWTLQGNSPTTYALDAVTDGIGCLNHLTLVVLNGVAFWLEGSEGIYAWPFEGVPQRISNPPYAEDGESHGIQDTIDRINWSVAEQWAHGIADPDGRRLRWWVPVDDSEVPNLCIVFDLKSRSWSTETCEGVTAAGYFTKPNGTLAILVGDVQGNVSELDQGDSDGVYGIEPKRAVGVASTVWSITVSPASLPTDDSLCGAPFVLVYASGEAVRGTVASNTAGAVAPYEALATAPASGDVLILGAIHVDVETNRFHQGVVDEEKVCPIMWVYSKKGAGEYYLSLAVDDDALALPVHDSCVGDLSRTDGIERFRISQIGFQHTFRLQSFMPGTDLAFRRFELQTQVRAKPETPR